MNANRSQPTLQSPLQYANLEQRRLRQSEVWFTSPNPTQWANNELRRAVGEPLERQLAQLIWHTFSATLKAFLRQVCPPCCFICPAAGLYSLIQTRTVTRRLRCFERVSSCSCDLSPSDVAQKSTRTSSGKGRASEKPKVN